MKVNLMIDEYCNEINNQKLTTASEQLKALFDLIVIELSKENYDPTIDDYCKIIDTIRKIPGLTLIDNLIVNNELFHLIQNFLIHLLNKWLTDDTNLTKQDDDLLREIVELFRKMIKHVKSTNQVLSSNFTTWFLNESFFKTISSLLNDISQNPSKYLNQAQNIESLTFLIQSIQYFQSGIDQIKNHPHVLLLIDSIIKCLCSSTYIDTLKNINPKSTERTVFEDFILGICPCYCAWYRGNSQVDMIKALCVNNMLESYQEIYDLFLPSIDNWEYALMESIYYMTALLRYVAFYPSTREYLKENLKLIDSILFILNANCLLDNILVTSDYNSETNLTDSAISFMFNLIHDLDMLILIKESSYFSKEIFLKLKNAQVDRVKLNALMILAKILNEQDIQNLDRIDELTSIFMEYLVKAMNDPMHTFQDISIEQLLESLKAFIQHDEIKEEIVKQNYIGLLIRCVTQKDLHSGSVLRLSLEIIWSLTFNQQIYEMLINNYENFFIYLKTILVNSTEEGVQAASKGILWKLGDDSKMKRNIVNIDGIDNQDKKYDIMISYSHSNKDLCHQVYHHLLNEKYTVWLDFENMYGSTLQSMATAIESSDIILICMSNPYKESAYCRSEAEYAYTRQRHIIPLVMEKKYRPDGWLGFICASKLYVDFTKTDFEQAFQKLIVQIQRHQGKNSSNLMVTNEKKEPLCHDHETRVSNETKTDNVEEQSQTEEQEEDINDGNDYECRYMEWWTHKDILKFLHDKNLEVMIPLFENELQFDGHSLYTLYERSQSNIESTYQLLNAQFDHMHNNHLSYVTYICFLTELKKQLNPIDIRFTIRYFIWKIWKSIYEKLFSSDE